MDPSEEKIEKKKSQPQKRSHLLIIALIVLLLCGVGGIYSFFNSSSPPPLSLPEPVIEEQSPPDIQPPEMVDNIDTPTQTAETILSETETTELGLPPSTEPDLSTEVILGEEPQLQQIPEETPEQDLKPDSETTAAEVPPTEPVAVEITTVCSAPASRLDAFYTHLDQQPYIQAYNLQDPSEQHFEKLIDKLLANPPKVTRESDDLYTILRNTAHFFRISGKDNILIMKGILNSEKDSLEQILADYYFLINTPECIHNKYAKNISGDALYEYACFFLNTMGGRLYLFRRDSESRMVVTYYAILLVDLANRQQNNRHGIALKPAVNMLIAEMESGGSKMKGYEEYLDILYDLKEKYQ